ncbi:hypothetical protein [Shimazuella kribbensis]|uniref:hypothetical protein n=1 Tax=Shimazuella kribbensis TaxID=139808 RepID=UPI0003F8288E|nr:hypothetical protein [Shimazuella kribbensis]
MEKKQIVGIMLIVLAVSLWGCSSVDLEGYANPTTVENIEKQQDKQINDLSDKDAIDFLQKAYEAQMSLVDKAMKEEKLESGEINTVLHPLSGEEIHQTLAPYQTKDSIDTFIKVAGETLEEGWLPHDEEITGYLVDYKTDAKKISFKRKKGQIEVTAKVYVEEQSPAEVIATLSNTSNGWRVSKIDIQ